jgi:Ni/Co efflux regulator RcnB
MIRMKFLLPAAALMLAGALSTATAQAAPAAGVPEAVKAASHEGNVQQIHWRRHHSHHRRHHHHRHHHHRHHRHW